MKSRRLICLAFLAIVTATQAGCLTTHPDSMASVLDTHADPKTKPAKPLPPDESAELCRHMAETLSQSGHLREAVGQYELARQYNPKSPVAHPLALLLDQLGQDDAAEAEFTKALAAEPKNADLYNDLGYHHYTRANWAEAEKYLRHALALNAQHAPAWNNLGMVLAQQERYGESLDAFGKILRPAEAQCNLAFILTTQGKRSDAAESYRRALSLEPNNHLARAALAKLERASDGTGLPRSDHLPEAAGTPGPRTASAQ
jgi:tetratricopeptide (TPR) repeat protein